LREALKQLENQTATQVGLHLDSAAAAYEEARQGFGSSLAELAAVAREESQAIGHAVRKELSILRRESGQMEVDLHEWCQGERGEREEAMRREQGQLRSILDARLTTALTTQQEIVFRVRDSVEPLVKELARESQARCMESVQLELTHRIARDEGSDRGASGELRAEIELRLARLHGEISRHVDATVRASKAGMVGQVRQLTTEVSDLAAKTEASIGSSQRLAGTITASLEEMETRLSVSQRGMKANFVELKTESHALHGGHVRELSKFKGELDEQERQLQAALSLLEGGVKREMEHLKANMAHVAEELNRLKLKIIQTQSCVNT